MPGITVNIEKRGNWDQVIYSGPINEDSELYLNQLIPHLGPNIIINFRKVESVNSCGVRVWINFVRAAEQGRKMIFEECTPEIVSQINMIPNFRGSAHIKSVYAVYSCGQCGHSQWQLFEEGRNMPQSANDEIPAPACTKCGAGLEMEELEDEFFAWIDAA